MHLAGLQARPDIRLRDTVAVEPGGEGVASLMRHDLDVVLRAVEIGEDERHMVVAQAGAVAARLPGVESTSSSSLSSMVLKNSPVSGDSSS